MLKAVYRASLLLIFAAQLGYGQPSLAGVQPEPAVAATLELFDAYPVVGIGEMHGLQELGDFYVDLVSRPDFAEDVGNVVFEFGNAFFQPTIDRYLAGEEVSYVEVKKAWTTMIGTMGSADISVMYGQFYKAVREANQTLPKDKKIKVWLGDPPTDPDDPLAYTSEQFPDRDAFFADIVLHILAKGEKALLIIGAGHFVADDYTKSTATVFECKYRVPYTYNVRACIDAFYPGKLFLVQNHWGLPKPLCNQRLEAQLELGPVPSLTPLRDTALATFLDSPECKSESWRGTYTNAWSDAYLYLGKSDELTTSPLPGEPETPFLKTLLKDMPELEEPNR